MRTKHSWNTNVVVAIAAAGVFMLSAAPVFATSVPAYAAGKITPQGSANEGCMVELNGGIKNTCGNQTNYQISLPVAEGAHSVNVSVYNPGGGTFWCQLVATTFDGQYCPPTGCTISPQTFVNTVGHIYQMSVASVTVPSQGSLFLNCNVNPGGRIYNVVY
jgi:hypothetical protein